MISARNRITLNASKNIKDFENSLVGMAGFEPTTTTPPV